MIAMLLSGSDLAELRKFGKAHGATTDEESFRALLKLAANPPNVERKKKTMAPAS
jgi:hypothetical protein